MARFAARDDALPSFRLRDQKAAGDAVFGVRMEFAGVGLRALGFPADRHGPQPKSAIERSGQDVFSVGTVGNMAHGRISCRKHRLQALSGADVPNPHQTVVARRYDARSIAIEGNRGDRIGMGRKGADALPAANVPQLDGFVEGSAHQEVARGIELAAKHKIVVAAKFHETVGGLRVPQSHGFVIAGGSYEGIEPVRPTHIVDAAVVSYQRRARLHSVFHAPVRRKFRIAQVPDLDAPIGTGRGAESRAVFRQTGGCQLDAGYRAFVFSVHRQADEGRGFGFGRRRDVFGVVIIVVVDGSFLGHY
mmetsp:Transcript_27936/g.65688  ORF Transcript_27936/g.65688 Transcript_27936/m.65688 type:complete len:305 (+) Transcript_27936:396-1310(+)